MRRLATIVAAAVLAVAPLPAAAQGLEALEAAEADLQAVWDATPLAFRKALYVTQAGGLGVYAARPDARFRVGDQILLYAEPVGYGYKANADGTYDIGFEVDLRIRTAGGELVLEQTGITGFQFTSHTRNREFMLTFDLDLTGAPTGDYVLEYTANDIASDESATLSLPFTIIE